MKDRVSQVGMRPWLREDVTRRQGFLLLEVMLTIAILTIGILGVLIVFQANFRASSDVGAQDIASTALENAVETLETADFNSLYAAFQGVRLPVTDLVAPNGGPASVFIQFDVNETSLPPEYGPVADIDGDGVMSNPNAAASYVLLPARLTLDYVMSYGQESEVMYLLLASR